jgi:hypothetical protein
LIGTLKFSDKSPKIFAEVPSISDRNPNSFIVETELFFLIILFVLNERGCLKGEKASDTLILPLLIAGLLQKKTLFL